MKNVKQNIALHSRGMQNVVIVCLVAAFGALVRQYNNSLCRYCLLLWRVFRHCWYAKTIDNTELVWNVHTFAENSEQPKFC
jgi:hypothetical protein